MNGRLAMAAVIGTFFHGVLVGSVWGDCAPHTGSVSRAFGSDLGILEPVGLWGLAGLTVVSVLMTRVIIFTICKGDRPCTLFLYEVRPGRTISSLL